jgi:MerR family transcriptional regulator, light-induced transcriptional regulator
MANEQSALTATQAADRLAADLPRLASLMVNQYYAVYPDQREQHGEKGVQACREDTVFHLEFLIAALRNATPAAFSEYISWAAGVLRHRNIDDTCLEKMLEIIAQAIRHQFGDAVWPHVQPVLDPALHRLQDGPFEHALYPPPTPSTLMQAYLQAILKGDRIRAQHVVQNAMDNGMTVREVYLDVFQPSLYETGRLWEQGQVSVAQEHLATAITQTILTKIYSDLEAVPRNGQMSIVACLDGNFHEIGPRMIADFLQMAGYESLFLGANTPHHSLLHMIHDKKPDVVGLPSTTSQHVDAVKTTIDQIRANFTSYRPTIMVGGLAFNLMDDLWRRVGGDVWGMDAAQAIEHLTGSPA